MMDDKEVEWFESWFDSPYYHILYSHRNVSEAEFFLNNLKERLHLQKSANVLDLACGKGRHSIFLNTLGYKVIGVDLSKRNIEFCQKFESENLHFYVHDMRRILRTNYFDAIFNLFTSFGYFESNHENQLVIDSATKGLVQGGYFILDYFNSYKTKREFVNEQIIKKDNIEFKLSKELGENCIFKKIDFEVNNQSFHFEEKVRLFEFDVLNNMMLKAGLNVVASYGDYQLNNFNLESSPRLILIARKL